MNRNVQEAAASQMTNMSALLPDFKPWREISLVADVLSSLIE